MKYNLSTYFYTFLSKTKSGNILCWRSKKEPVLIKRNELSRLL